jgi:hypothetical protein
MYSAKVKISCNIYIYYFLLSIHTIKNDVYIYIYSLCIIYIIWQKPNATNMQRRPELSLLPYLKLLGVSIKIIELELAEGSGSQLREHKNALLHVLRSIKSFCERQDDNAYLTTAMRMSLHDRLILPFAYEGVIFVLEVVYCSRCYMKNNKTLDICFHGLSVSLLPATEHKQFVPTDFVGSLLYFAIPRMAGSGFGIRYYEKLETAFPDFPGASSNLTDLIPIMNKYGWDAKELRSEKDAINAEALELATTHCCKVNAQIEKYCNEIMDIDCGSARVAPVEQDGHTADHGQTSVDVGTVLGETRLVV